MYSSTLSLTSVLDGRGCSTPSRGHSTPGRELGNPLTGEAGWIPRPVWTGAENLALTGIQSPDRSIRSESLYQMRYPVHFPNRVTGTFTRLWARRRRNRCSIQVKGKKLFLLKSVHIVSEAHTASYSVVTGGKRAAF